MAGFRGRVRDDRVGGGRGSRGEGRDGKGELPNAGGEERRKKWDVTKSGFFLHYFLS